MKIARILLWRLGTGVAVLWGTVTLIFIAINLTPGDTAITILGGPDALPTAAQIAQVRLDYGLDKPLYQQYGRFVWRIAHGDLGDSFSLHVPVTHLIAQQAGATATLTLSAAIFGVAASLILALLTANRTRSLTAILTTAELTAASAPSFIVGLLLLLAFSFSLHLFPASSTHGWTSIILPTITLSLPIIGVLSQVLRRQLEEVLEQPFIVTARARGLSDAAVRLRHALRHALIPALTVSGLLVAGLLASAVVVETVFNRQGLGRLMADATANRDVPLVIGIALVAASANVAMNIAVDLLYVAIDPRLEER